MIENISNKLHVHIKNSPLQAVNFKKIFEYELFGLALKQVSVFFFFGLILIMCLLVTVTLRFFFFGWGVGCHGTCSH